MFTVRPEKIALAAQDQAESGALTGLVQEVIYIGTDTRYLLQLASGQSLIARVQNGCQTALNEFQKGVQVRITWRPEDAHILTD